jgi:transposase
MRYQLTDFEWSAIRPFLPNKPRGIPRVDDGCCSQIVDTTRIGSGSSLASMARGQTFPRNEIAKTLSASARIYTARKLDRTVLSKIKQCRRVATRQARGQLPGLHQARINPHLAAC